MATRNTNKTTAPEKEKESNTIKKQEKEIESLKKQLETLMATLSTKPIEKVEIEKVEEEAYIEINPNKKTKITSLCYGTLTLYADNRGFLVFNHYGDTKTITYAQLCDYINSCRNAAERGLFYIHNQEMVEDLGLASFYTNIIHPDMVEKIKKNGIEEYKDFLNTISDESKEVLGKIFAEEVFNKKMTDLNLIDKIGRCIGIDIMEKVDEMKEIDNLLSADTTE